MSPYDSTTAKKTIPWEHNVGVLFPKLSSHWRNYG